MFDFRRITLFSLEKCLSKHKMTIFSKTLRGAMTLWPPTGYTYERSSCFVRNCKLQRNECKCSGEVKTFVILQSCSGDMFVGFVLMELLQ